MIYEPGREKNASRSVISQRLYIRKRGACTDEIQRDWVISSAARWIYVYPINLRREPFERVDVVGFGEVCQRRVFVSNWVSLITLYLY